MRHQTDSVKRSAWRAARGIIAVLVIVGLACAAIVGLVGLVLPGSDTSSLQAVFVGIVGVGGVLYLAGLTEPGKGEDKRISQSLATALGEIGALFIGVGGLGVAAVQLISDLGPIQTFVGILAFAAVGFGLALFLAIRS